MKTFWLNKFCFYKSFKRNEKTVVLVCYDNGINNKIEYIDIHACASKNEIKLMAMILYLKLLVSN